MQITVSDIASLYRPSKCERRVYLETQDFEQSEASAYDECLRKMGINHEQQHLATLGKYLDLSQLLREKRIGATTRAISEGVAVIYQGGFSVERGGTTIVGYPDFLIANGGKYIIRDSKLSRKVDEKHHTEIMLQLQLYGWLFEQSQGVPPVRLEVHAGGDDIIPIDYDGGVAALGEVQRIAALRNLKEEPYEPLGWSKCNTCGFNAHCWRDADKLEDVALIPDVDQGLARVLFDKNIKTPDDLLKGMKEAALAELKRPWGAKMNKVGVKSSTILKTAEVFLSRNLRVLSTPVIQHSDNYIMFDLEGIPPQLEDVTRIYLWGAQVYGKKQGIFQAAVSGFGTDADEKCWKDFLALADDIINEYGDAPWVHYATYEATNIKEYISRYGDPDGIAARVQANLFNLHPICKSSVILPIPSYSLKVIEKYIGFERSQDEYGGTWAIAKFIEAVETNDEKLRDSIMTEILKYNEEDLAAMWAVFEWVRGLKISSASAYA